MGKEKIIISTEKMGIYSKASVEREQTMNEGMSRAAGPESAEVYMRRLEGGNGAGIDSDTSGRGEEGRVVALFSAAESNRTVISSLL